MVTLTRAAWWLAGTTGQPKGVLTTHGALEAQITDLVSAWRWTADDHILHFLPLHHVHGVVNKLCCALWTGALVEFIKWDPVAVWRRIAQQHGLTLFMAVPTVRRSPHAACPCRCVRTRACP